jgi:APA family basic amino acid/polyamine antiporter
MYSLPTGTWLRFGGWLLAGLAIYFAYGVRHSKLQMLRKKTG